MDQPQHSEFGLRWRVKLIAALVVMAALVVISAVGIGVTLHGRTETQDSLDHWRAVAEDEAAEGSRPGSGFESPKSRIQRLEKELDAVPGRLFPLCALFVVASVLLVLGYRKLRPSRRTA